MKNRTGTKAGYDIPAGPIWNNGDANSKCPKVCSKFGGWNKNWKTTKPGQQSVCGCRNLNTGAKCA